MSVNMMKNHGVYEAAVAAGAPATFTASSTTSPVAGDTIDRLALGRRYLSAKVILSANMVLGSSTGAGSANATLTPTFQDSPDGSTWANYATDAPATAVLYYAGGASASSASSTGTPAAGVNRAAFLNVDLTRARRYIRALAGVAVASSSTTSGAGFNAVTAMLSMTLGGAEVVPAT